MRDFSLPTIRSASYFIHAATDQLPIPTATQDPMPTIFGTNTHSR